jgi:hypothetical protein
LFLGFVLFVIELLFLSQVVLVVLSVDEQPVEQHHCVVRVRVGPVVKADKVLLFVIHNRLAEIVSFNPKELGWFALVVKLVQLGLLLSRDFLKLLLL